MARVVEDAVMDGPRLSRLLPRVAGGALSAAVVLGFVVLGVVVVAGRSLRSVARAAWGTRSGDEDRPPDASSHAA